LRPDERYPQLAVQRRLEVETSRRTHLDLGTYLEIAIDQCVAKASGQLRIRPAIQKPDGAESFFTVLGQRVDADVIRPLQRVFDRCGVDTCRIDGVTGLRIGAATIVTKVRPRQGLPVLITDRRAQAAGRYRHPLLAQVSIEDYGIGSFEAH